jgi:hypothetical protein
MVVQLLADEALNWIPGEEEEPGYFEAASLSVRFDAPRVLSGESSAA